MTFYCIINHQSVELPIFFHSTPKCHSIVQKLEHKPNPAQLSKMKRCKVFSEIHSSKALASITEKLVKE